MPMACAHVAVVAVAAVAAVFGCVLCFSRDSLSLDQHGAPLHLGPSPIGRDGRATLEKAPQRGQLPRLVVTGGRVYDEEALVGTYSFFNRVLALKRPFTVLWDPRRVVWPALSSRQLRMIREWVDEHARQWDTHVQAHAVLLTNPIVRSLARLVIRLFAPPQPIRIVRSEQEALEFHATCCPRPRSWVKASYADRDERFGVFGAAWKWTK
jgi:hypothetical protein